MSLYSFYKRMPQWLIYIVEKDRHEIDKFIRSAAKQTPKDSWVLDAGCGDSPYRSLFIHTRYLGLDVKAFPSKEYNLDILADLCSIPLKDEQIDVILCVNVLEHIPEPQKCIREFYRVLKPQGLLWLVAPLASEVHHEPCDFFRFTCHGLEYLLRKAGFSVLSLKPRGGHASILESNHEGLHIKRLTKTY